jgi:hypothetical protein
MSPCGQLPGLVIARIDDLIETKSSIPAILAILAILVVLRDNHR